MTVMTVISSKARKEKKQHLMKEHTGKTMHTQLFHHIKREGLSRDLTFVVLPYRRRSPLPTERVRPVSRH